MFDDPSNIKLKRGPGDFIFHTLKAFGHEVIPVQGTIGKRIYFQKAKTLLYRLFGKKYWRHRNEKFLRLVAKDLQRKLASIDHDIVFAFGGIALAYLETDKPMYVWTDTSFAGLLEYKHPLYVGLAKTCITDGHKADQWVLDHCRKVIYSSDWAAECALRNYKVRDGVVAKVPLGANIESYPSEEEVRSYIDQRWASRGEGIKLLLVGNNWQFKGGPIALDVVKKLNQRGIKSHLVVIGCSPELSDSDKQYTQIIPRLNKNIPAEAAEFNRHFAEAFLYFMPTRAEAFGHVFCEAGAFALPTFGSAVGGVQEIIHNSENGFAFPFDASSDSIADYFQSLYNDESRYRSMSLNAYSQLRDRLLWEKAVGAVLNLLEEDLKVKAKGFHGKR